MPLYIGIALGALAILIAAGVLLVKYKKSIKKKGEEIGEKVESKLDRAESKIESKLDRAEIKIENAAQQAAAQLGGHSKAASGFAVGERARRVNDTGF